MDGFKTWYNSIKELGLYIRYIYELCDKSVHIDVILSLISKVEFFFLGYFDLLSLIDAKLIDISTFINKY